MLLQQRYQNIMVALLAIEQLTGTVTHRSDPSGGLEGRNGARRGARGDPGCRSASRCFVGDRRQGQHAIRFSKPALAPPTRPNLAAAALARPKLN